MLTYKLVKICSTPLTTAAHTVSFVKGGFVVKHTNRYGSSVPMDQELEKAYNKPAKCQAGIIGVTRRKEAVLKWNLIKHEKNQFTDFL